MDIEKVNIYFQQFFPNYTLFYCSSPFGYWDRGQVALIHGGDITIKFGVQSAAGGEGYAALDDIRISTWAYNEEVDCDMLPPLSDTTPRPCEEGAEFTCKLGGCIE